MSRRAVVLGIGGVGAGLAAGLAVGGCSGQRDPADVGTARYRGEYRTMALAAALEIQLVSVYRELLAGRATGSGSVSVSVHSGSALAFVRLAETCVREHEEHAAVWNAMLAAGHEPVVAGVPLRGGGSAAAEGSEAGSSAVAKSLVGSSGLGSSEVGSSEVGSSEVGSSEVVDSLDGGSPAADSLVLKAARSAATVGEAIALALRLEVQAAQAYVTVAGRLSNAPGVAAAASIAPVEAMHAAMLRFMAGEYPTPVSFLPGG